MAIDTVLKIECCETNLKAKNKEEALIKISESMAKYLKFPNEKIFDALQKREKQSSTGFDNGIAIPHSQIDGLEQFVIGLFVSKHGIEFDSIDKKRTKILIVILGPKEQRSEHLKLLAQTSRILKEPNAIENIKNQSTKIGLYEEFLRNANPNIPQKTQKGKNKLMILTVRDLDILQDISEVFIEYEIVEATSINSEEMENVLSKTPLFFGFFDFTNSQESGSKMIFIKINENIIDPLINEFENIFGNLNSYSGLSVMTIDIEYEKGM
ncbi:MAG: PTS sugar transporter subunit IIA [Candidatus Marinimicrobia bacterium]|nr:PTS sugar transporter subunit IIA [Candidatus Neomarinimicrobiota bacterium]